MKRTRLHDMTVDQLVERFLAVALEQYEAIESDDNAKFRRLFREETDIIAELKSRAGDQRRALMSLYDHPNPQVRYTAASATKEVAPDAARRVCEIISERNEYPQAVNARWMLSRLAEKSSRQP